MNSGSLNFVAVLRSYYYYFFAPVSDLNFKFPSVSRVFGPAAVKNLVPDQNVPFKSEKKRTRVIITVVSISQTVAKQRSPVPSEGACRVFTKIAAS